MMIFHFYFWVDFIIFLAGCLVVNFVFFLFLCVDFSLSHPPFCIAKFILDGFSFTFWCGREDRNTSESWRFDSYNTLNEYRCTFVLLQLMPSPLPYHQTYQHWNVFVCVCMMENIIRDMYDEIIMVNESTYGTFSFPHFICLLFISQNIFTNT